MTSLSALVTLCLALESTPGRLDKLRLVTDFLSALGLDEAKRLGWRTGWVLRPARPTGLPLIWFSASKDSVRSSTGR